MLQIVYACDRVLSPLDIIAILGTNHSTIYTFCPPERFIISMFKIQFHCGYLFYMTYIQYDSCTYMVQPTKTEVEF